MAAWRERAQAWQPAAPTLSAFSVIKPRREASLALQALQFPAARGWSPAEGPWTKAPSSLHPWPRPAGPLQQGREPEFAGSRPRRPQAGEETTNPDPSSPRFHRPPARPGSAPPARPPGPRTSRKVSVFISLQGVSTIRAASRTPSVALAKHWGGNAGCGWGGGRGTRAPPLPVTPPGPEAVRGAAHLGERAFGAADRQRGAGGGGRRVTLLALTPQGPRTPRAPPQSTGRSHLPPESQRPFCPRGPPAFPGLAPCCSPLPAAGGPCARPERALGTATSVPATPSLQRPLPSMRDRMSEPPRPTCWHLEASGGHEGGRTVGLVS